MAAPPLTFCHIERKAKRGEELRHVVQGASRMLRGNHDIDSIEVRKHDCGFIQEAEAGADALEGARDKRCE